ncbi:MAG TPA: DUF262 domain-containing protein [Terriglobales bacterium]|nr:DUF262 domain-containing protein [Terriglobales bacterium]
MPTHYANLDALIRREDFEVRTETILTPAQLAATMQVSQLESASLMYQVLRKPDFQRETANWEPEKVAELIQSFLEGDLIPSVILWRSPKSGNIFVIDGAHRLSAFIAWVHDDYGDKQISVPFFANLIPPEQVKAAEKTRQLLKEVVGSYQELKVAGQHQHTAAPERLRLAKNLAAVAINLQWVIGEAAKAESSFFKINQKATLIDPTELDMITARRKPNALATRALIRAGTGHKYWSAFSEATQSEIEQIARDVYDVLFKPAIETPIKTLDLPIAGRGYSADSVKMVFDLVNFVNRISPEMWEEPRVTKGKKGVKRVTPLADDEDGSKTLEFLKAVKKAASLIAGTESRSLGLHPVVYFYGATGRFQPTAFLSTVAFIRELEQKNQLIEFTKARYRFEEFLLKYRHFSNQIGRNYGSSVRGLNPMLTLYRVLLSEIQEGLDDAAIVAKLQSQHNLRFLKEITEEDKKYGRNFSVESKNAAFFREAMQKELTCAICHARLHFKSISMDHVQRKQDGGTGSPDNAQLTHPYCNSGYKEKQVAQGAP